MVFSILHSEISIIFTYFYERFVNNLNMLWRQLWAMVGQPISDFEKNFFRIADLVFGLTGLCIYLRSGETIDIHKLNCELGMLNIGSEEARHDLKMKETEKHQLEDSCEI